MTTSREILSACYEMTPEYQKAKTFETKAEAKSHETAIRSTLAAHGYDASFYRRCKIGNPVNVVGQKGSWRVAFFADYVGNRL